jgi:hypothetical protein
MNLYQHTGTGRLEAAARAVGDLVFSPPGANTAQTGQ